MPKQVVVIDPGHGGNVEVGGSSWNNARSFSGVMEKSMTLQMALLVREALQQLSTQDLELDIVMTRVSDRNLGLPERAGYAKRRRAARFLSIHFNGFNGKTRGVETIIRPAADQNVNVDEDRAFAIRIQQAVVAAIQRHDANTKDRGIKEQKLGVLSDNYLGNTPRYHPCRACLVEIEFIDVEAVDKLLNLDTNAPNVRKDIATSIATAIVDDLKGG